jgi:hypothetical protein
MSALDDYVTDTNPVRVVDVFVEELDLHKLGFAYFTPSWTRISRQAGQAFHTKLDTDFTASWTAISRQAGQ